MNLKKLLIKSIVYIVGLFVMALGVSFSINSGLGISPINSIPYVLNLSFGFDLGHMITFIFGLILVLQILILRSEFKIYNLSQIIFSYLFGFFTDFTKNLIGDFTIPSYFGSLILLLISIILIALGLTTYVSTKLINMPIEGFVEAIKYKYLPQKSFGDIKIVIDVSMVIIAIILSFVFLGRLEGIREGTVLSAIFVGFFVKIFSKIIIPFEEKLESL
ncbi:hypothetical protein KQI68_01370 [Peptoniphilus sp. MSJ-1]|uniref:BCR, YitT family n=1 Tax=Peptoniphilus ovalis TaxID=2841503 RepID=A0ABS6FE69_9FIRM|nr:DUF6198 family protein [Peptoniphilus ovalis]MBU5668482.1 hypothetical protein [Peptoniphilus ovalis]